MPTARQKNAAAFDVSAYLQTKKDDREPLNFFGVIVPVPTDMPLGVTLEVQEQQRNPEEANEQNILQLLSGVLGEEVAEEIKAVDAGVRACGALLLWAYHNAGGDETSYPEAYEEYEENERAAREAATAESDDEEDGEGKPPAKPKAQPNRAARRAQQSGKASAKTSR